MEIHDFAPEYALGVLDEAESERFATHLASCEECQSEVEMMSGSAEVLFEAAYETPPDGLKSRVMGSIDSVAPAVPLGTARKPVSMRVVAWVAAAAVIILTVGIGLSALLSGDPIGDIVAAPDAQTIQVAASDANPATNAELDIVYSPSLGKAVLTGDQLGHSGEGTVYQMWLIGPSGPVPAGIFQPDDDGHFIVLVQGRPTDGEVFGITIEPAGGSDEPTGDVLFVAEV